MNHSATAAETKLTAAEIAQYRRDGWVLLRRIFGPRTVEACRQALSDLALEGPAGRSTVTLFEAGHGPDTETEIERELRVRKFMDFLDDAPALRMAAMNPRLHGALDQLLGQGRVLFQEMALVKPPRIGSEKPWHQDASYFRITDPSLIAGVWIALDPATRSNGCMELVPGSHLGGGVPHRHENDLNRCEILPEHVAKDRRIAIEMEPGDALVFHSLLHHFTEPNRSDTRRRAVQFHYHQTGAVWSDVADHTKHFQFADGSYAGCTVPHAHLPGADNYKYRAGLERPIVPVAPLD
jgi:phytanoyl-CoA hydroxylase